MKVKKLSVIVPVFNEENWVKKAINRVLGTKLVGIKKEVIVVNDGSTDKTLSILKTFGTKIKLFDLKDNYGKGRAIKIGLAAATGEAIVIQDADLEYDPQDYKKMLLPIQVYGADVVYGSRFMGEGPHRVLLYWHMLGNSLITTVSNAFTNLNLTDVETGYKMFTQKVAVGLNLEESGFNFDPEFTAKVARGGFKIYEVGISYAGRAYVEGKKINWVDGLRALWCIVKYNVIK